MNLVKLTALAALAASFTATAVKPIKDAPVQDTVASYIGAAVQDINGNDLGNTLNIAQDAYREILTKDGMFYRKDIEEAYDYQDAGCTVPVLRVHSDMDVIVSLFVGDTVVAKLDGQLLMVPQNAPLIKAATYRIDRIYAESGDYTMGCTGGGSYLEDFFVLEPYNGPMPVLVREDYEGAHLKTNGVYLK